MEIGAICLNLDVPLFGTMQRVIEQASLADVNGATIQVNFSTRSLDDVREAVLQLASNLNVSPRALSIHQRRNRVQALSASGLLQIAGAIGGYFR